MSPNEILVMLAVAAMVVVGLVYTYRHTRPANDVTAVAAEQLRQARILQLQHRALAEEHGGLAAVYAMRVKRLEGDGHA